MLGTKAPSAGASGPRIDHLVAWLYVILGGSLATVTLGVGAILLMASLQAPVSLPVVAAIPVIAAIIGAFLGYRLGKTKRGE